MKLPRHVLLTAEFFDQTQLTLGYLYQAVIALRDGREDSHALQEGLTHLSTIRQIGFGLRNRTAYSKPLEDTIQTLYDVFFAAAAPVPVRRLPLESDTAPTAASPDKADTTPTTDPPKKVEATSATDPPGNPGAPGDPTTTVLSMTHFGLLAAGVDPDLAGRLALEFALRTCSQAIAGISCPHPMTSTAVSCKTS